MIKKQQLLWIIPGWRLLLSSCCMDVACSLQSFHAPQRRLSTTCHQHVPGYNKCTARGNNEYEDYPDFLRQVEETVARVLTDEKLKKHTAQTDNKGKDEILSLSPDQRESFGVARVLQTRLQAFRRNNDCPRCWLQRAHCICHECPPLSSSLSSLPINRIFLVMHHKEICLAVDTAKLILASFPHHCRLVVAGIGPEYQPSMKELQLALLLEDNENESTACCRVLFPTEDAQTVEELLLIQEKQQQPLPSSIAATKKANKVLVPPNTTKWDIIVLDGTWSQAQKLHRRYIPATSQGGPPRIQLSSKLLMPFQQQQQQQTDGDASLRSSSLGHQQLRRHPIDWRTISTMEATRLLLKEISEQQHEIFNGTGNDNDANEATAFDEESWDTMLRYQSIANNAARRQLGPPRVK